MTFQRLVRFHPKSNPEQILVGEPEKLDLDVGKATRDGEDVSVKVYSGSSVLSAGEPTDRVETIEKLLSPLAMQEVGTIRCIGLNYKRHAAEVGMAIPSEPTIFLKPATALADPYPAPTVIPKHTLKDDCCDYEAELAVVIGKTCKNVTESEAMSYILGYTASNDVSSRASQLSQSQWCYSKGYDGACPIGPVIVSTDLIPDPSVFKIRGLKNGKVEQQSGIDDMVFNIAQLVSFCSQGTTLPAGTVIITGTPAGVGVSQDPTNYIHEGDEFTVEITPHIGSLITNFVAEK